MYPQTLGSLSEAAAPRLEDTLRGIEHVGRGPHEARVVSPEDLIDVLMRCVCVARVESGVPR